MLPTTSVSVRFPGPGSSPAADGVARLLRRRRGRGAHVRLGALLAAAGLVLAARSSSRSGSGPPRKPTVVPVGTVTFALSPGNNPNHIFPLEGSADCTVANSETCSSLFWRPLDCFGIGAAPLPNEQLSLAYPPRRQRWGVHRDPAPEAVPVVGRIPGGGSCAGCSS